MRKLITDRIKESFIEAGDKGISTQELYKILKEIRPGHRYSTTRILVYCLKRLNLIEEVGIRRNPKMPHSFKIKPYRIIPGRENAEEWELYPIQSLYPSARSVRKWLEGKNR